MEMQLTLISDDRRKYYEIRYGSLQDSEKIWICNNEGEGGAFNALEIGDKLFEAIDKFFKENF